MRGMDIEKASRAAVYVVLAIISPFAILLVAFLVVEFLDATRTIVGFCIAAGAIVALVRWINRPDAPKRVDPPARNPDEPPE